jgi:hypothetical protein
MTGENPRASQLAGRFQTWFLTLPKSRPMELSFMDQNSERLYPGSQSTVRRDLLFGRIRGSPGLTGTAGVRCALVPEARRAWSIG